MKWLYTFAAIAFFAKILLFPGSLPALASESAVALILEDSGGVNTVSGIVFRNRLYDTLFEVIVFTIAIMGVRFLMANEQPAQTITQFTDAPSVVLARLGATVTALIGIELAIRGHLSPGGGFAAGIAGGTAVGLIAITSSTAKMEDKYQRWHAATWEKVSVLLFIAIALLSLSGLELPQGNPGDLLSGGWIPILNSLVAIKVALGSWAAVLIFVRYRGLL